MASMQNIRGTDNTALIPKYWEKKYLKDQHEKDPLKPFYGTNSIVVTDYDLKAKKGDTVVVPIAGLPSGAGVTDDGDYDLGIYWVQFKAEIQGQEIISDKFYLQIYDWEGNF